MPGGAAGLQNRKEEKSKDAKNTDKIIIIKGESRDFHVALNCPDKPLFALRVTTIFTTPQTRLSNIFFGPKGSLNSQFAVSYICF